MELMQIRTKLSPKTPLLKTKTDKYENIVTLFNMVEGLCCID